MVVKQSSLQRTRAALNDYAGEFSKTLKLFQNDVGNLMLPSIYPESSLAQNTAKLSRLICF